MKSIRLNFKVFIVISSLFLISFFSSQIFPMQVYAQSNTTANPSGLKVPRFSSTRSKPINVRVGPGKKYEISWVYVKSGIPIEVIAEFDVWRKIKDYDGSEGWIHQSLVSSKRVALIKEELDKQALFAKPNENTKIIAWLGASYPLELKKCDIKWCEIQIKFISNGKKEKSLKGFILRSKIWGIYKNENFD